MLTKKIFEFLALIGEHDETSSKLLDKKFFETVVLVLRVFKLNREIYEYIFKGLAQFNYEKEHGKIIVDLNYPFLLAD